MTSARDWLCAGDPEPPQVAAMRSGLPLMRVEGSAVLVWEPGGGGGSATRPNRDADSDSPVPIQMESRIKRSKFRKRRSSI